MIIVAHRVPWRRGHQHIPTVRSSQPVKKASIRELNRDLCQLDTSLEYFADEENGSILRLFVQIDWRSAQHAAGNVSGTSVGFCKSSTRILSNRRRCDEP